MSATTSSGTVLCSAGGCYGTNARKQIAAAGLHLHQNTADRQFDLDAVLHPGRVFAHPTDVLHDSALPVQEKRAILASWASDACALESAPALRRGPPGGKPVSFDEVMDALRRLDGPPGPAVARKAPAARLAVRSRTDLARVPRLRVRERAGFWSDFGQLTPRPPVGPFSRDTRILCRRDARRHMFP